VDESNRRLLTYGGVGLVGLGAYLYLTQKQTASDAAVQVSVNGPGQVLVNGKAFSGRLRLPIGTRVTFQAQPNSGATFTNWTGTGGTSTQNPLSLQLTGSGSIQANFAATSWTPPPAPPPPPAGGCPRTQVVGHWPDWDGSLWGIAQQYYGNGALYPRIYAANVAVIEATAQAHGFPSSDGGHWIFPGEVLCIP